MLLQGFCWCFIYFIREVWLFTLHSSLFCALDDPQQFGVLGVFFSLLFAHIWQFYFWAGVKKQSFASKTGLDFSLLYRHCFAFKIQLIFIHFTVTGPVAETPGKTVRNWREYRPQMYQLPMERNPKRLRRFLTSPPFVLLNIQIWKGSYNNRRFLYE